MRVFFDRLVDDKDREWLFNEIRLNVGSNFKEIFDVVFKNLSNTTVC
jgi:dynein heavy chain